MRIHIVGQGFQIDAGLRTYMEQRLRFALSRFGSRIGRVHTQLTSCQGSQGSLAVQCCLTVQILHLQQSRVEVTDADVRVAIDCAIDRTERFVSLALSSQQHMVPTRSQGKAYPIRTARPAQTNVPAFPLPEGQSVRDTCILPDTSQ